MDHFRKVGYNMKQDNIETLKEEIKQLKGVIKSQKDEIKKQKEEAVSTNKTAQLQRRELGFTVENLKLAQSQLIQSEKWHPWVYLQPGSHMS